MAFGPWNWLSLIFWILWGVVTSLIVVRVFGARGAKSFYRNLPVFIRTPPLLVIVGWVVAYVFSALGAFFTFSDSVRTVSIGGENVLVNDLSGTTAGIWTAAISLHVSNTIVSVVWMYLFLGQLPITKRENIQMWLIIDAGVGIIVFLAAVPATVLMWKLYWLPGVFYMLYSIWILWMTLTNLDAAIEWESGQTGMGRPLSVEVPQQQQPPPPRDETVSDRLSYLLGED